MEDHGMDNSWWLIILFVLLFGGNGFGMRQGDFSQFATNASQNEILLGQKFDNTNSLIQQVANGLCSSTYALNNTIQAEGRGLQTQMCSDTASINATTVNQTQKILDALAQNKIDTLQAQVSTLSNQLAIQNATCGVPKVSPYMYNISPSCCGCNI